MIKNYQFRVVCFRGNEYGFPYQVQLWEADKTGALHYAHYAKDCKTLEDVAEYIQKIERKLEDNDA